MDIVIPICICPWCREVPEVVISEGSGGTWICEIRCRRDECSIRPTTFYVSLRKTSKKDASKIENKIRQLFDFWNNNNPFPATHGKLFNFQEIAEKGFPYMNGRYDFPKIEVSE